MKIPSIVILACPQCHGKLKVTVDETKDEVIEDVFAEQKSQTLRNRFTDSALLKTIEELGWPAPTSDSEWIAVLLHREIVTGTLECSECAQQFMIKNRIPVFVQ